MQRDLEHSRQGKTDTGRKKGYLKTGKREIRGKQRKKEVLCVPSLFLARRSDDDFGGEGKERGRKGGRTEVV